jgi:multiple sugar transport system ATP-binding protein
MDEPLSSLDAKLREELRVEIKRIQQDLNATVVYVTHDQVEATTMADRIGILEAGQLRQVGTPQDVYENPCSAYVAQRLGSPAMNFLPVAWFAGHPPPGASQVAVRPEDIRLVRSLADAGKVAPATSLSLKVIECSLLKHELIAERDGVQVNVSSVQDHQYASGDLVHLEIPVERCLYFSESGQRVQPH